jgi:hypothetical protein
MVVFEDVGGTLILVMSGSWTVALDAAPKPVPVIVMGKVFPLGAPRNTLEIVGVGSPTVNECALSGSLARKPLFTIKAN